MIRRFSATFAVFSICMDALIVAGALFLAFALRPMMSEFSFARQISLGQVILPKMAYIIFPLIWISVLSSMQIYNGHRYYRAIDEVGALIIGSALSTVLMAGFLYLSYREISRLLFITFVFLAIFGQFFYRGIIRLIWRHSYIHFSPKQRIVILGAGEIAEKVFSELSVQPDFSMNLVGFVGENSTINTVCLGGFEDAYEIIGEYDITDIVIALPNEDQERINDIVRTFYDLAINIWVVPDYFSLTVHQAEIQNFGAIPMMNLRASALTDLQRIQKRFVDLLLVFIAAPILIPVMALLALAIRLDSEGKVFFLQDRIGENGRLFKMVKFRTMVSDAEEKRHLVEHLNGEGDFIHKVKDDPRVTRVGRLLRRTSLDELPQVINVFRGEMSIVGPRPEMPYLVEKYDLWQRKRFAIPQGITGWWQVNGRSELPMHLNTEFDLYYIQHYSVWLDLVILIKTVGAVIKGKGAF